MTKISHEEESYTGKIIPRFISKLGHLVLRYFELEPKPHSRLKRGECGKKGVKRGKRKKEQKKKKRGGGFSCCSLKSCREGDGGRKEEKHINFPPMTK